MKTEADGSDRAASQGCLEPSEPERSLKELYSRAFRGGTALPTPRCQTSGLQD